MSDGLIDSDLIVPHGLARTLGGQDPHSGVLHVTLHSDQIAVPPTAPRSGNEGNIHPKVKKNDYPDMLPKPSYRRRVMGGSSHEVR